MVHDARRSISIGFGGPLGAVRQRSWWCFAGAVLVLTYEYTKTVQTRGQLLGLLTALLHSCWCHRWSIALPVPSLRRIVCHYGT